MAWTYADLRVADAALGITDPWLAAAALNAQTAAVQVDVATSDARALILPTLEYAQIELLSESRDFAAMPKSLVLAAMSAVRTLNSDRTVKADDAAAWAGVQTMLAAFVSAGVLSAVSRDAILALRTQQRAAWSPHVTDQDIIAARNL